MAGCDTVAILASGSLTTNPIFAKNREMNEAQSLVFVRSGKGGKVKCTYTKIDMNDSTSDTFDCLLSKPFWTYGAEMGVNQNGVAIGNEAIFTSKRAPYKKQNKDVLLGMDIVRITLERAKSARNALEILTKLHETYDQGGNAHFFHPFYYHNAYLIVDRTEAWIVETAGKDWVARRVKESVASISNFSQIGTNWDLCSQNIKNHENFSQSSNDSFFTFFGCGRQRQCQSQDLMFSKEGKLTVGDVFEILRDHRGNSNPREGVFESSICMHTGAGPVKCNRTTGSMVVEFLKDDILVWVTGTGAPCTSVFNPIWFSSLRGINLETFTGNNPTNIYDEKSLWWQHEILYRNTILNYPVLFNLYKEERDLLETRYLKEASVAIDKIEVVNRCFEMTKNARRDWIEKVKERLEREPVTLPFVYGMQFRYRNKQASCQVSYAISFRYPAFILFLALFVFFMLK